MEEFDVVVKKDGVIEIRSYERIRRIIDIDKFNSIVKLLNNLLKISNIYYNEACDVIYKTLFVHCKEAGYYSGPWLYVDVQKIWNEDCKEMTVYTIKENERDLEVDV